MAGDLVPDDEQVGRHNAQNEDGGGRRTQPSQRDPQTLAGLADPHFRMETAEFAGIVLPVGVEDRRGIELVPLLFEQLFLVLGVGGVETPAAEPFPDLFGHRVMQKQVYDLPGDVHLSSAFTT